MEKSNEVLQANWREEVILNRNLHIINRSQNTVANRITVEQKIMNKRFQKKLQQSKTAYAKITGNKQLEVSLRQKNTFVLNTNLGQGDENDVNLKKIWKVGDIKLDRLLNRGKSSFKQRALSAPPQNRAGGGGGGGGGGGAPIVITLTAAELGLRVNGARKSAPPRSGAMMESPVFSPASSNPPSRRPSTSAGFPGGSLAISQGSAPRPRTVGEGFPRRRGRAMSDVAAPQLGPSGEMGGGPRVAFAEEGVGLRKRVTSEANLASNSNIGDDAPPEEDEDHDEDEPQGGEFFKTVTNYLAPAPGPKTPKPPSRQLSRPSGGGSRGGGLGMSMFGDSGEGDITLLDIHKLRIRAANYSGRVNTFCKKLKLIKDAQKHDAPVPDYYATRLVDYAASGKAIAEWRLPGTPESEVLREMGNIKMKSLTLKQLSQNFANSQTQIAY